MKKKDSRNILFIAVLIIAISGVVVLQNSSRPGPTGTPDLMLNEQDLQQFGLGNGTNCRTEEQTSYSSQQVQYSICIYNISSLNDTQVVIELKKFATYEDLNGTYQYESLHLYSVQGIISENDYGDQSRFRVNNENDYGGQYNDPNVYYYHLWICKDEYLIHITSGGRSREAEGYIARIGRQILSKFD